jgi:hypothetical protein
VWLLEVRTVFQETRTNSLSVWCNDCL